MTLPPLAGRTRDIAPFHVMRLLARARELEAAGRDIVHMEVGEPDFETPEAVRRAGCEALLAGRTHYTPAAGLARLRAALADEYRKRFGVAVAPERILVTPGASGALQLVVTALLDPGSAVMLTDPGYPCNRHFARMVEGAVVPVPVGAESGYQLTRALAEAHWTDATRMVLVASPANPSGTCLPAEEMAALHALCRARGAWLVVDEIYQRLVYDRAPGTALALGEDVVVLNSFSKYHGMTGWRLGWLVAPPAVVEAADRIAQNLFLAAPTVAQWAALTALEDEVVAEELERRRRVFRTRRDFLLPALRGLGFEIPVVPEGAFYLYARLPADWGDSMAFCERLLEEAGVAITPGADFGRHQADRHVRFAYTTAIERLAEGVRRIEAFLAGG
ncbi:MAG: pyridoxal phosphate-dependent aminotransferase [Gammaproteobacteria bacterium]|nr:MAG: pyridoxal phosphate-dependent aminotransferase [Gammaproteobacteria bacterium]